MSEIYAGERLHRLRKRRALSLEEVGQGVGVTSSHISQIENGKRQPSFGLLAALADYFDVDPTFFIETKGKFYGHGRKIKQLREVDGISCEELAMRANLDDKRLSDVETGLIRLDVDELKRVVEALGRDMTEFNDCVEVHLNKIREICGLVLNMTPNDTDEVVAFVRKKIRVER